MNRSLRARRGATVVELIVVVAIILTVIGALMLQGLWGAFDFAKGVIEGPGEPSVKAYEDQINEGMNQPPISN